MEQIKIHAFLSACALIVKTIDRPKDFDLLRISQEPFKATIFFFFMTSAESLCPTTMKNRCFYVKLSILSLHLMFHQLTY